MKLLYKVNEKLAFEFEAEGQKPIFEALATLDEVFGIKNCGRCGDEDIYFRVRTVIPDKGPNKGKKFTYYEMVCRKCGSFLAYGQHLEGGTLYPNRNLIDEDGSPVLTDDGRKAFDKEYLGWKKPMKQEQGEDTSKPAKTAKPAKR